MSKEFNYLVKDFSKIRPYIQDLYIRDYLKTTNNSTYDQNKRRIFEWLQPWMVDILGKKYQSIKINSRYSSENPLFNIFKYKSFSITDMDCFFMILDILHCSDKKLTTSEITDALHEKYEYEENDNDNLRNADSKTKIIKDTVQSKLNEYTELGIIDCEKNGNKFLYKLADTKELEDLIWYSESALRFFTEISPLGFVGSTICDTFDGKYEQRPSNVSFRHHYIVNTINTEIEYTILSAIDENKKIHVKLLKTANSKLPNEFSCSPVKIYQSLQEGFCSAIVSTDLQNLTAIKLNDIEEVFAEETLPTSDKEKLCELYNKIRPFVWGTSFPANSDTKITPVKFTIESQEPEVLYRLQNEARQGQVQKIDDHTMQFSIELFDAKEIFPWVSTFIGYLKSYDFGDETLNKLFTSNLQKILQNYGDNNE